MQRLMHLLGAQVQIRIAVIGDQKTESIRMTLNLSFDQIQFFHHANVTFAVTENLPFTNHRRQAAIEKLFFLLGDIQQLM